MSALETQSVVNSQIYIINSVAKTKLSCYVPPAMQLSALETQSVVNSQIYIINSVAKTKQSCYVPLLM